MTISNDIPETDESTAQSPASIDEEAHRLLRQVFGYDAFRGHQLDVIRSVVAGENNLVLMPTGGGKSLCYQIPALMRSGTAVVVSPLIALMRDQVEALRHYGIRAAYINSSLDAPARAEAERALASNELDLVYVAPERLLKGNTLALLERIEVGLFAIDEAHCVSQWGHDFRPEYMQLDVLRQRFPDVPRIALTATADLRTRSEIESQLLPDGGRTRVASFDRPNIRYQVGLKHNARDQLLTFIRRDHDGESGIVYCLSRKRTEAVAEWLSSRGVAALPYHAGLDREVRQEHQERFLREEGLVMVATVAFGMGIDKPDVRFVAHLDLPKSIESYYQETGRAGRDGLPSNAWMVYGLQDVYQVRQLLAQSTAGEVQQQAERQRLEALLAFCESTECRRKGLLGYFGEAHDGECGNCDNCLQPPETWDATEPARKALSCVYRTGQGFGAVYVIDVLTGKADERIRSRGHDRISTFGIGTDLDKRTWQSVFRQLLARGYLQSDPEGFGRIGLSDDCRALLRGEEQLLLRKDVLPSKQKSRKPAAAGDVHPAGWEMLRKLRREQAESEGVPPYVIFHDATLMEMLRLRPQTLDQMAQVPGVGQAKLDRYGQQFLDAIKDLDATPEPTESHRVTVELKHQGLNEEQIAEKRGLAPTTVREHLTRGVEEGAIALSLVLDLADGELNAVREALVQEGGADAKLRPVFDALEEAYDFETLKLVRAEMRYETGAKAAD